MTDLSSIKQQTEENVVRKRLTVWLESHGAAVYWGEEVDEYDQETFRVESKGIGNFGEDAHRPDILASFNDHTTVIEVKTGNNYGDIGKGVWELFEYWEAHQSGRLVYTTEEGQTLHTPDSFTLATRYSPFGHIYNSNHEFFYSNGGMPITNDKLPQYEANMSGVTIRSLWWFAKNVVGDGSASAGIGFLYCDILQNIPEFDSHSDSYGMVRSVDVETVGSPSIFHWKDDQDWLILD